MFFLGSLIVLVCLVFLWGSNPVHGVLTLVVVGLGFASLLLGEGLEFSALIVVLVYVGAVTVLFIFVVMMVNLRSTPSSYVTAESYLLWGVLAVATAAFPGSSPVGTPVGTPGEGYTNLNTLGFLLYGTERAYGVFLVGGVLFVAMVAAICLSLVSGENYRTQEFYTQIRRPNGVFNLAVSSSLCWGGLETLKQMSSEIRAQSPLKRVTTCATLLGGGYLIYESTKNNLPVRREPPTGTIVYIENLNVTQNYYPGGEISGRSSRLDNPGAPRVGQVRQDLAGNLHPRIDPKTLPKLTNENPYSFIQKQNKK